MFKKFLIEIIDEEDFFAKLDEKLDEREKRILLALKEEQELLMTTSQCLEFLGICNTTLHKMIKRGQIPFFRVGNKLRFSEKEVRKAFSINNSKIN